MARDSVKFVCGCKFQTRSKEDASAHVDDTGHVVSAQGYLHPNNDNNEVKKTTRKKNKDER